MKKILYTIIAFLGVISCTKEDIQDINKGNEIDFHTSITRATEMTLNNLGEFYVTAAVGTVENYKNENEEDVTEIKVSDTDYFTNVLFSKDGSHYKSSSKYYWPSATNSFVDFYAYSPSKEDIGVEVNRNNFTEFTPAEKIADQKDIIMAYARGSKAESSNGVALDFDHILSQIELQAYNPNPGYVIKVKGARIGKVCNKGDFSYAAGQSWNVDDYKIAGNMVNYEIVYETAHTLTSDAVSIMHSSNASASEIANANAIIIPQGLTPWAVGETETVPGSYLAALVNIKTADGADVFPGGDDYEWIATPLDGAWVTGFKYIYKMDLSTGGYVAPDTPNIPEEDPDNPDPNRPKPGDEVLGGKIQFKTTYSSWDSKQENSSLPAQGQPSNQSKE